MSDQGFGLEMRRFRRRRGLSLRAMQTLVRYDFTYLGQVERGEKPGSFALAATCDDALKADGRLLELFREESPGGRNVGETNVRGDVALSAGRAALLLPKQNALVNPGMQIDSSIEKDRHERSELDTLRALYHGTYSVGQLASAVEIYLADNSERLARAGGGDRRRLLRERADASVLAGRLALFDRWLPVAARGYLTMACEAAVVVEDHALAAGAFGHLAFVPVRERLGGASLDYLEAARWHAERAGVSSLVSWVAAVEGEVRAVEDPAEGLRALDRASGALSLPADEPDPAWFDFYSSARLEGFRGQALLAAGRGEAARASLARALAALAPDAVKQRAVILADMAASHLCDPDPDIDRIAAEAIRAATELRRTRYRTAAERLAELRGRLEPWSGVRAVRDLDEALAEMAAEQARGMYPSALARGPRG